ncbi:MAG: IS3 family transposase, partial [Pseudomonadota bacterium]
MVVSHACYYAKLELMPTEVVIVEGFGAICATSPAYGFRRVDTELRHRRLVVNSIKVRRIMREQGLQPKRKCLRSVRSSVYGVPVRSHCDLSQPEIGEKR